MSRIYCHHSYPITQYQAEYFITVNPLMESTAKQRVPTGLTRKQKSPYALQYLQFQRRLEPSRNRCRLPTLAIRMRGHSINDRMNGEEYLAFAKQLKQNKEAIKFGENKENEEREGQDLNQMKFKLDQVKGKYITTKSPHINNIISLQNSQQMVSNLQPLDTTLQEINSHRSRALSNALHPLKELNDENISPRPTFLQYKKGKRQLPSWIKND